MTIWVDGDSAPRDIRPILLRRATSISVRFIASRKIPDLPDSMLNIVPAGPDSVDRFIEENVALGDLVITRDIPFAERLVESGIAVINDRGESFIKENIAERRSLRDTAAELRNQGLAPASPKGSQRTAKETKRFADGLDRVLAILQKK